MPEGRVSPTNRIYFCDLRNFAAEGAENQRSKLVGGLCGRAIPSGLSRANPRRLSLPEAGIPTTGNLFPFSVGCSHLEAQSRRYCTETIRTKIENWMPQP